MARSDYSLAQVVAAATQTKQSGDTEEIIGQNQGRFIKLAEQKIDLVGVSGRGGAGVGGGADCDRS